MRIGHGYDVHAFTGQAGNERSASIVIGGVTLSASRTLEAHSDGDVLLHAICDALLGAAGLGDIGRHFPDTDPQFHNADSRGLLRTVIANLADRSLKVVNIDSTIIAQAPKMAPHISQMQRNIADDCEIQLGCVNVKATTTEKLGFTGREEGIACHAVALIESVN